MAKQLFLSPVIGDGLSPDTGFLPLIAVTVRAINAAQPIDPQTNKRPIVAAVTPWMPTDPESPIGAPFRTWALCVVAAKDLRPFQSIDGVFPLPVFPLDGKVSAVQRVKLLALLNKLDDLGIDKSFAVNEDGSIKADGWREVIRGIGQAAGDTSFSEDAFDCQDIA